MNLIGGKYKMNREIFEAEGYKIEVIKGTDDNVFNVYSFDGRMLEGAQSIDELIQNKFLNQSKRKELSIIAEKLFANELENLSELYHSHRHNEDFFNKYFNDRTMTYKFNKVYSKEVKKKIEGELKEMLKSEDKDPYVYIEGNKINLMFDTNPKSDLRSFNVLYDKIIKDDNFSLIGKATKLIENVNQQYILALKSMEIIEKFE
jgi:hypothetical protein